MGKKKRIMKKVATNVVPVGPTGTLTACSNMLKYVLIFFWKIHILKPGGPALAALKIYSCCPSASDSPFHGLSKPFSLILQ